MKKNLITVMITTLALVLTGCGDKKETNPGSQAQTQQSFKWKLVTSWPKNFPGLGVAPEKFAKLVSEMSGGRLTVHVYGAGELVPGFEVFDAVSQGTVQMGHSAAYYWKGKNPAAPYFAAVPFGMNAREMNAWLHYGGGLELWQEIYQPFGVIPMAGGNSGAQFAGWFNKEINSLDDLQGLKMRIPGMGGEVLKRAGGVPVNLTGGEIFTSLQSGAIDATEWVGPYNDLALGLHQAAKYYYYSSWHEPATTLEFIINEQAYGKLPKDLQAIVKVAARAVNEDTLDEYTARNNNALQTLVDKHQVELKALPEAVMKELQTITNQVISEQAAAEPDVAKVWQSYQSFLAGVKSYHKISEQEYYKNRH
jgi:TRAP-type mannitol/chloroaromatic compound transport system substrate-binding protein